jgi:hypothetical protein
LRGKLSQGTEAKELDTNRLTKHCGWKRSIYWSANFLHSNRDAAPADLIGQLQTQLAASTRLRLT